MNFIRRYGASILLIVVACNHIYRHYQFKQSSWGAGCGFGMFATVDYHDSRFFRCYLVTDDGEIPVRVATYLASHNLKTRVLPTARNLESLAKNVVRTYRQNSAEDLKSLETRQVGSAADVKGLRLEIWSIEFRQDEKQIRCEKLRDAFVATKGTNEV